MARYITSIRTYRSNVDAFEYMADLRNFEQWDPGVHGVTQIGGDGAGSGASFDVVVDAPGRGLTLRYHTTHFDPPRKVVIEARSRLFTSIDRIDVRDDSASTVVTYDASLALNGPLRVFDFLLRPVFNRIGDRAKAGLFHVLDGQPA
jgi:Polyketide cyclase / dehydrase and lipid transport